jgi:DNA (cytosine-5)-methyltransferase 1
VLRHLDLFSGIGGFALAAQMVGGIDTQQFVEIDPYCQKVLSKNFPGVPIHGDIREFTARPGDFDIITGGFPCQDISCANPNGRGLEGERSGLFYELMRIVRECRPDYIVLENVAEMLRKSSGRIMGAVLWELSESGYDAEWQTISAASVGAPHLRERVFIVAYSNGKRCNYRGNSQRINSNLLAQKREASQGKQQRSRRECVSSQVCEITANSNGDRLENRMAGASSQSPLTSVEGSNRLRGRDEHWTTEPGVLRVDARVPNRVDRIKGLGNAVVPQVAATPLQRVLDLANP